MTLKGVALGLALGLMALGCGGAASDSGTVYVRVVNLVRGASSIQVTADTGLLATGLAYGSATSFGALSAYPQAIFAKDVSTDTTLGTLALNATSGAVYTLYASGAEGFSPAPSLTLVQETKPTASATGAVIRFGNFSTALNEAVDVYFSTPGDTTTKLSSLTPVFSNVAYGAISTYATVSNATTTAHRIRITPTGSTSTVLVDIASQSFTSGDIYSIYETDASAFVASLSVVQDTY